MNQHQWRICFLFNAQRHQLLHGVSTAAHLARRDDFDVHIISPNAGHIAYARHLVEELGGAPIHYEIANTPMLRIARRLHGSSNPPKLLTLATLARKLNRFDAIALPERTSIFLKRLGVTRPAFIHLDHGAGDRAAGFDRRIRDFDLALMAGEKTRARLEREGLIHEGRHAIVGYPKFEAADAARDRNWRPFANDKPIVLYNPHFSTLGSWDRFGVPVVEAFAEDDRYNLIVAPHVRLLDGRRGRDRWADLVRRFGQHPNILLDAGSDRSIDMSYTALADIYLGDVSSQIYEFLRTPKPCLFLDAHDIAWEKDENYAHWHFGPVLRSTAGLLDAIDAARASHADYLPAQQAAFAETFAIGDRPCGDRAADAIADFLAGWHGRHPALSHHGAPMRHVTASIAAIALLAACGAAGDESNAATPKADDKPFVTTVMADFDSPWAMTFLPDGRMLVTEKDGRMLLVSADAKSRTPLDGIPAVDSAGQGALMDVVLHPKFAENRLVYFSFSEKGAGGKGVALARGVLVDGAKPALDKVTVIFRGTPYVDGDGHYSGRIAFAPDGHLFFTNGERQKFDPAQDPKATLGKVLRLNDDGTPAAGNPLAAKGFHPAVWSYGHRNLLGLAFDAQGNLWEQEMGPRHGDELNLILPGRNYGYPIVSNGDHYDGRPIPDHDTRPDLEAPKLFWNPAISPAGLMIYSGAMFPAWQNSAFIGAMNTPGLVRVQLDGTNARKADQWDMDGQRIREVEQGPDGAVWLLEDGNRGSQGRLLRLMPKG